MFSHYNLIYILTSLQSIEQIIAYSEDFIDFNEFLWANKRLNFNATLQLLMVIGEETKKIDNDLKRQYGQIPWRSIQGVRNRIAHDYRGIDHEEVYAIVIEELKPLKKVLIDMLGKVDYEQSTLNEALNSPYYSELSYLRNKD
ncbi:HepT-like ribonuclease domain-containing protein [Arsenicibacter rosenii]|uniref:DUF86 domain-containing protein n=1 Tax=Arsenicibacter rosenii TaxID=1750698 RepID=A0A1S2VM95_9BACT|nr:HepT-like ribonuclease domain-containing protein [Arsenicibacter rosenii]OIN59883.1 hypothetical protein BLX24_08520 [Arsenicibacter rosenii]